MTSAAGEHPRPLSLAFARQLPQSGSLWQSMQSISLCQGLSLWEDRKRGVTVGDGEGEPAVEENIFRLFPENATFLQKSYNFFLKKAVFPLTALL